MKTFNLLATAAAGIEGVVARELKALGYAVHTENGRVRFQGDMVDIARTNLWLRTADRIKIIVGEFEATSFEELFDRTYDLPWEDLLPMDAEFPVAGRSIQSQLSAVPSVQAIVKKAIAKKIMTHYSRTAHLTETGALYPIEVAIRKNRVLLTLDTSGSSLFKRGYRLHKGAAPLKENMAAALILLTTWFPDRPFIDPTCGSGTLCIEAALIGRNIAPGLYRSFVAEDWIFFDPNLWQKERQLAREAIRNDVQLNIMGSDIDAKMIEIARENAEQAGVSDAITFKQMQVKDLVVHEKYGILISNPPYGDRMLSEDEVHDLYRQMGETFAPMTTWSKYILSSDENFEEYYGSKATRKRKLYNGPIRVDYYQYWGEKEASPTH